MWFETDADSERYYYPNGEMLLDDGRTLPFTLFFVRGTNQVLFSASLNKKCQYDDCDLEGDCEFFPDKLIIHVETKRDNVYGGKYDTIVFIRQPKNYAESNTEPQEPPE